MKKLPSPAPKFHSLSFTETIAKSKIPKPSINRTTPYIEIISKGAILRYATNKKISYIKANNPFSF